MTNPYETPSGGSDVRRESETPETERTSGWLTALVSNVVFVGSFFALVACIGYVLETEGGGIRLVELAIFPIGIFAIAMYLRAMFLNFKHNNWIWAICIAPVGPVSYTHLTLPTILRV